MRALTVAAAGFDLITAGDRVTAAAAAADTPLLLLLLLPPLWSSLYQAA
jgi:hypothetical protein